MMIKKKKGFSMLEVLIALGIASILIVTAMGSMTQVFRWQRQLEISQTFYQKTRHFSERIVYLIRYNTIDYDRYFIEEGPDGTACSSFLAEQLPGTTNINNTSTTNREGIGYSTIFSWDTDSDDTQQDENLGGQNPSGSDDPCSEAFSGDMTELYLINGDRTIRTALRLDSINNEIELQTQLGIDSDNDGKVDEWGPSATNPAPAWDSSGNICEMTHNSVDYPVEGDNTNEDFCARAHDWVAISSPDMQVNTLSFVPAPTRDPFLAFAVESAQVHPHVFLSLDIELADPGIYGLEGNQVPEIQIQTTASSRVVGNTR